MKSFTGWEYLLIDACNQFGGDKLTFEKRIEWATQNINELESLADQAETKPLFIKAVMALRKAQAGIPTGHLVAMDACCSGIQIMSVLTGCMAGATATGLVNPDVRADAYSDLTKVMQDILGSKFTIKRADAKQALMTTMYGSKATPKIIFGEDTPEIDAFYEAAEKIAPGPWELLQELLASWNPYALTHEWVLPDGFYAKVKVMTKKESRIEVDELDHATFTYEFYVNEGQKKGLSNAANVIHSIDAYILRSMHRRCNYNREEVEYAARLIKEERLRRTSGGEQETALDVRGNFLYYAEQYARSGMADAVILPWLDTLNVCDLTDAHLEALNTIVDGMLEYQPFEIVTIHDSFAAHANNVNHVRQQYINILAELAESNVLADVLGQLHGTTGTYQKSSSTLGDMIRKSCYALS